MVIIGVWAAYFIQYWVRRREHLATAQSVDQFSESMRVLERRNPKPVTGAAGGSATQATSAHAAYSQLLLRRAATAQVPASSGPADEAAPARAREGEPSVRPAASARRTRGLVMLGALSTAVVTLPLLALSMLPLWTLLVPVLSVAGSFAWVRASARAEQRARRADARPPRRAAEPVRRSAEPVRRPAEPVRREVAQPTVEVRGAEGWAEQVVGQPVEEIAEPVDQPVAVSRGSELYDVQAVEAAHATPSRPAIEVAPPAEQTALPARPLVDEDDIPLTWDPVPVPRPTYTMKARVTRPAPTSADLVGDADTEYAPVEDEQPARRAAGA